MADFTRLIQDFCLSKPSRDKLYGLTKGKLRSHFNFKILMVLICNMDSKQQITRFIFWDMERNAEGGIELVEQRIAKFKF